MRDVNVIVTGNAYKVGIYTLSGNSNPLQALVAAGGINEFGSYRDIKVKRNNRIVPYYLAECDFFLFGDNIFT